MRTYKYWVVVRDTQDRVIFTHLCNTLEEAKSYGSKGKIKIKKIAI